MKPSEMETTKRDEAFSRGFDRGSYGNAYESQNWASWYANLLPLKVHALYPEIYREGLLLGFFSSYELHEVPMPFRSEVKALREKHKRSRDAT